MNTIIRIDDKTTGGGTVLSGSTVMFFRSIGVARQGDPVNCPTPGHGRDNGVPIALHGHRRSGGCTLRSSLPEVSAI